ncbi:MAG: superoxide dismutase [Fe] [Acidobacteria bacterium 37-65-4]|nr:MAG: superoxide dismutase [Fe] [Acidobacteria bacterium 37-65-4]HQT95777.1 superoxide dismutase [Thermoanaerobaculaceae bacterium]
MAFILPPLPYPREALTPNISAETIDFHYGKHHQAYVTNLNNLTAGTPWESKALEEIVLAAKDALFNNAAQVWNHTFYWNGLKPGGGGTPTGVLADAIAGAFGGFDAFKEQLTKAAVGHFGSGWAWLVLAGGKLAIESTANAGCPLREGKTPLLTCDVWEHAYYIDYRNARPKYVDAFWGLVNWDFVAANLTAAKKG